MKITPHEARSLPEEPLTLSFPQGKQSALLKPPSLHIPELSLPPIVLNSPEKPQRAAESAQLSRPEGVQAPCAEPSSTLSSPSSESAAQPSFFQRLAAPFEAVFKFTADLILNTCGNIAIFIGQSLLSQAERPLNEQERAFAERLFGSSLDLDKVRISRGNPLLFALNGQREVTLGNVILAPDGRLSPSIFIHELTHVWQFQNGGADYTLKAAYAQAFGEGYDWQRAIQAGATWEQLNPEQQGQLIQDLHTDRFGSHPNTARLEAHERHYDEALKQLHERRGAP